MRLTLLLVIALLFLAGKGRGQGTSDTAAILEARAAFKMISRSPDSAIAIAERKLAQAQQSGDKRLAAFAYKARGWAWMHKGSYDKCFPDLLLSVQLFRELHDPREEMATYMNLAL